MSTPNHDAPPSEGRFARIEYKLDGLIDDFADFRVDVTGRLVRLETTPVLKEREAAVRVSDRSYFWMKVGIAASTTIGVVGLVSRFIRL